MNQPNLVLFVGEALVGNEAVDQLSKFNQSLVDFAIGGTPRKIDGILLTKFDTIDDKVFFLFRVFLWVGYVLDCSPAETWHSSHERKFDATDSFLMPCSCIYILVLTRAF